MITPHNKKLEQCLKYVLYLWSLWFVCNRVQAVQGFLLAFRGFGFRLALQHCCRSLGYDLDDHGMTRRHQEVVTGSRVLPSTPLMPLSDMVTAAFLAFLGHRPIYYVVRTYLSIRMHASLSFNLIGGNTKFPVFPVKRTTLLMIYLGHLMETCKLLFCSDSCDEMGTLCCLMKDAVFCTEQTFLISPKIQP